jgi:hypothetical protein
VADRLRPWVAFFAGPRKTGLLTTTLIAYDGMNGHWDADDLQQFLDGREGPPAGAIVKDIMGVLTQYLELQRPQEAGLLACWIVRSYVYPFFPAYPRLDIHRERGSGKSKLLQLIARLAFNGLHRVQPTPATLYRLIGPFWPTFCLDEMEGLSGSDARDICAIINSGYKDGAMWTGQRAMPPIGDLSALLCMLRWPWPVSKG